MSRLVRKTFLVALIAGLGWYGGHPALATPVCVDNIVVGRLCVQPDPYEPVTCEQTGALATCQVYDDPCAQLTLCQVCPTGDPCGPPLLRP